MQCSRLIGIVAALAMAGFACPAAAEEAGVPPENARLLQQAAGQAGRCQQRIGPFRSEDHAGSAAQAARRVGYAAGPVVAAAGAGNVAFPRYFFTVAYIC